MDRGSGTLLKQMADFVIVCIIRQYTRASASITRLLYPLKVRLQYIELALSCNLLVKEKDEKNKIKI